MDSLTSPQPHRIKITLFAVEELSDFDWYPIGMKLVLIFTISTPNFFSQYHTYLGHLLLFTSSVRYQNTNSDSSWLYGRHSPGL